MNLQTVEQIVALINEHPVSEITLEQEGSRVHVRRSPSALMPSVTSPPSHAEAAPQTVSREPAVAGPPESPEAEPILLTAPMVGLFHHARQPVRYGGLVSPGDVVGSIESMKLMNDVPAPQGGRVVEVLVEDGGPVEYGQALFRLAPA